VDYFLQFCGFTDPLQLFYLEQRHLEQRHLEQRHLEQQRLELLPPPPSPLEPSLLEAHPAGLPPAGPVYGGFRPFQLDDLLAWALEAAQGRHWDREAIQGTVVNAWMERADLIRQWQLRLRQEPAGRLLVAAIGSRGDWGRHCEALLRA